MECIKSEEEELFFFSEDHDIGSIIGNYDDVLKDPLLSWPVTESDGQEMLLSVPNDGNTMQYSDSFSEIDALLHNPASTEYSCQNSQHPLQALENSVTNPQSILHSQDATENRSMCQGAAQRSDLMYQHTQFVKIESKDRSTESAPELLKLLRGHDQTLQNQQSSVNQVVKSDMLHNVQPNSHPLPVVSVPVQSHTVQSPVSQPGNTVSIRPVPAQPVPVQPVPVQSLPTQKILISPQQTSTVQICSLLTPHLEDTRNTVVALPSNQALAGPQLVTSTSQVPVQQFVLHTQLSDSTAAVQRPVQLVIDPKKLPVSITSRAASNSTSAIPPPKVERHRAHNAIEKKYRTSINDKIVEMRNLLFGAEAKIQKSGVLKKAIDHIKQLRSINSRLRHENMSFKIKLEQLGVLSSSKSVDSDYCYGAEILPAPLTPESIGDVHSSSTSCSGSPPSSPCKSEDSYSESVAMLDRTRVGLCIIMLSFFIFDPFNLVLLWQKGYLWQQGSSRSSGFHGSGRLLRSEGSLASQQYSVFNGWSVFSLMSFFFRSLVIGFLFLKLFVFGEPSLQPDSKVATKYWSFKRQADLMQEKGEYIAASKVLCRCLETLGRPLPTSRLDVACSLVWHVSRQLFHRLWIGRWLTTKAVHYFSFRSADKKEKTWREESAKQASLVYHKLNQLYLTGNVACNSWLATVVALNAVNLAEMAGSSLSKEKLVEIYIDAAIQLRSTLPKNFQFLARYFLRRARRLCRGQSLTLPYLCWWLFTPIGHRFFVSGEWSCKRVPDLWTSSKNNENKPLMNVTQTFCRFLLEQALSSLLLSRKHDPISPDPTSSNSEDSTGRIQALDMLHTLAECLDNSRSSSINRNFKVFGEITSWPSKQTDVVGCWWTSIAKVAACWLVGDIDGSRQQRKIVENIPEEIENNDNPIGKALLMAFRARACLLGNEEQQVENAQEILDYCDKGGALLRESITFASLYPVNNLLKLMHLLCSDWLLCTRSDLWERQKCVGETHLSNSVNLDGFDKDLKSLQSVCSHIPEALPKVYMYQATCRMMAGANPLTTRCLLQRMRQACDTGGKIHGETDTPPSLWAEKDRATALMMASSYLPPSLFTSGTERKEMLLEALESFQKIGEKDRITRCRKLLMGI